MIQVYEDKVDKYKKGKIKEQPQAPKNYDQLKSRVSSIAQREDNSKGNNGPIMERGAWHLPTAGKTPAGLKDGLQTYAYKKK